MMFKRNAISTAAALACAAASFAWFPAVHAETLVYDGSQSELLQTTPEGVDNSLIANGSTGNTVIVSGGEIGGNVYGGYSENSDVDRNTVNISGGTIMDEVYGARTTAGYNATNNTVNVTGGTVSSQVIGGSASQGTASGNTVNVTGGEIGGNIMGGRSSSSSTGDASNNVVRIVGGNISSNYIIGGSAASVAGAANNNTVIIGSAVQLSEYTTIQGGGGSSANNTTGNTLNIAYNGTVKGIENFQFYNFQIASWMRNGDTQIRVTDDTILDDTHIKVRVAGGGSALHNGDIITLLEGSVGTPSLSNRAQKGISLLYDVSLAQANPSLQVRFSDPTINPQTRSFGDGRVAQTTVANLAGDLAAGQGMRNAVTAAQGAAVSSVFGAISGGSASVNNGAELDVNTTALMLGASKRIGAWMLGGFVEAGKGSYNTRSDFTDLASVSANGNTNFYGLGLLGRYDFGDSRNGAYADASLRLGRSSLSYASGDLCDVDERCATYDNKVRYVGGHIGAGYALPLNPHAELNFSSRYLWNRLTGNAMDIVNDPIVFNTASSNRLRNGLRLDYTLAQGLTPYLGAAYEHEFGGDMTGTAYGVDLAAPSLKGGTTIAEAGFQWRRKDMHATVSLQSYFGKRSGSAAQLAVGYQF